MNKIAYESINSEQRNQHPRVPSVPLQLRSVPTKQERSHLHDIGLAPTKLPNREGVRGYRVTRYEVNSLLNDYQEVMFSVVSVCSGVGEINHYP